jgi:peptidyl-prolyl cis-trans isomerase B (cyclophilin B)
MSLVGLLAAVLCAAAPAEITSPQTPSPASAPAPRPQVPATGSAPAPQAQGPEVVLETTEGSFVVRLLPAMAPNHVALFLKTARSGGYDGTTFHRIIPGGIIQGGDPLSKDPKNAARYGTGGLGLLKAEFSDRPFTRGVVAAARKPSSNDSGGVQFFVVLRDQPSLRGQYTIFGEVSEGMEVVDKIGATAVEGDKPKARVEIKKATAR